MNEFCLMTSAGLGCQWPSGGWAKKKNLENTVRNLGTNGNNTVNAKNSNNKEIILGAHSWLGLGTL